MDTVVKPRYDDEGLRYDDEGLRYDDMESRYKEWLLQMLWITIRYKKDFCTKAYMNISLSSIWYQAGRKIASWSPASRDHLHALKHRLNGVLLHKLSRHCTHIKNHGGVKASICLLYTSPSPRDS